MQDSRVVKAKFKRIHLSDPWHLFTYGIIPTYCVCVLGTTIHDHVCIDFLKLDIDTYFDSMKSHILFPQWRRGINLYLS